MTIKPTKLLLTVALALVVAAYLLVLLPGEGVVRADDKEKKIKITVKSLVDHGNAPLPVHFVAEISAPSEMDEEIYKSGYEWVVMGRFVLTDAITGGDPTPVDMRSNPMNPAEYSVRSDKHLVSKTKNRPPRKPFEPGMEVQKSFEFDFTFEIGGEYFVQFRMKHGKYASNEVRLLIRGDTSYDPYRQQ
jgi:hypothetical protein